jgi:hypothetical protein
VTKRCLKVFSFGRAIGRLMHGGTLPIEVS